MGDFLGILGFLGFFVCLLWLIISLFTKRPLKIPAITLVATIFIFFTGVAITPPVDNTAVDDFITKEVADETVKTEKVEESGISNDLNTSVINEEEKGLVTDSPLSNSQLEVHFIDVGQGDSIYIKTSEQNILVDGGDRGDTVLNYLRNKGVQTLDLVIGTHPHADHIGGLINVFKAMPVAEVIDPAVVHTTKTFEDYLTIIDQKDIKFTEGRAGIVRNLGGGATMQVIHPSFPSSSNLNDASIVARVSFGNVSFLLTGDANQSALSQILNSGYRIDSTILKVGHHGSKSGTTQAFLDAVNPEIAIIMCGKNNSYGHPHEETLKKLNAANADIFRTDLHGTVVIITDGQTYTINKEPNTYVANQQPPPIVRSPESATAFITEGEFVGSKNSDKYHYPNCHYVNTISETNRVWFDSVQAAVAAGYVACKGCNPPSIQSSQVEPIQKSLATEAQVAFVGSRNSDKYHYPTCGYAKKIKPENLRWFNSAAEAVAAGYVPCKGCNPP
jgi:competence protein ComEC